MDTKVALIQYGIDMELPYRALKSCIPEGVQFDRIVIFDKLTGGWKWAVFDPYYDVMSFRDKKRLYNGQQILPILLLMLKKYNLNKDEYLNIEEAYLNLNLSGREYDFKQLKIICNYTINHLEKNNISQYNIIGMSMTDRGLFNFIMSLFYIRTHYPDKIIVVGGPWFSRNKEITDILLKTDMIDTCVYEDGEYALKEIILKYINGESLPKKITQINDLNTLPDMEPSIQNLPWNNEPAGYLYTSKGCMNKCSFCQQGMETFRNVKVNKTIEQLSRYHEMGIKNIFFSDNVFGYSKRRLQKFYEELKKANLLGKINFSFCYFLTRTLLDEEVLNLIKEMKMHIHTGVESFSQNILTKMNKGITAEGCHEVVKNMQEKNIHFDLGRVFLFPGETLEDFNESKKHFVNILGPRIQTSTGILGPYVLYSGSPVYEHPSRFGVQLVKFPDQIYNIYKPVKEISSQIYERYIDLNDQDDILYNHKSEMLHATNRLIFKIYPRPGLFQVKGKKPPAYGFLR